MKINIAKFDDLKAILYLQKLAYQSEAKILNDYNIQPLKETLEEIQAQFEFSTVLKAEDPSGVLIGSVRATKENETIKIGKLIVHPKFQNRGIGSLLLEAIEKHCPATRYELFTSKQSLSNLVFYAKRGYIKYQETEVSPKLTLIYLEKRSNQ